MDNFEKFIIGVIMILCGVIGIFSIKSLFGMIIGLGFALIIISLAERLFVKDKQKGTDGGNDVRN